ncbi:hypothetical protein [Flavobacterium alkalisoli]|uniref:hypothetical protein n=1 Tax=Flavobacterium alkalisoli TaxID=2602769 RepID=UPI003A930841
MSEEKAEVTVKEPSLKVKFIEARTLDQLEDKMNEAMSDIGYSSIGGFSTKQQLDGSYYAEISFIIETEKTIEVGE